MYVFIRKKKRSLTQREGERAFHLYVQMSDKVGGRLCLLPLPSLMLSQLIIRTDPFDPTGRLALGVCVSALQCTLEYTVNVQNKKSKYRKSVLRILCVHESTGLCVCVSVWSWSWPPVELSSPVS